MQYIKLISTAASIVVSIIMAYCAIFGFYLLWSIDHSWADTALAINNLINEWRLPIHTPGGYE